MPKIDVGLCSRSENIGKISFEIDNIHAFGGPEFPKLVFPLDLRLNPLKSFPQQTLRIHPLTWMFLSGEFSSPEQRAVANFRQDLNVYADGSWDLETQCRLEIPLNLMAVERIEQSREGNLRAALKFDGFIAVHAPGATSVEKFETTRIQTLPFTIPKSLWVEKLLPQLGYGMLELIEVRISKGASPEGIPKAVEEIRKARAYLTDGDNLKAVAHCRNALEAILQSQPLQLAPTSTFRLKTDTFISDHLASKLAEKQSKLLADEMKLLWEICSEAAHPTVPDYFKRVDANFIVRNTTAILEYVSGLLV